MINHRTIFIVSFLIFIIPFLGFPEEFDLVANSLLAIFLMTIAVIIRLKKQSGSFVEDNREDNYESEVFEEKIPETKTFEEKTEQDTTEEEIIEDFYDQNKDDLDSDIDDEKVVTVDDVDKHNKDDGEE